MTRRYRLTLTLVCTALLCGCNLTQAAPSAVPTATTVQISALTSPIPTLVRGTPASATAPGAETPSSSEGTDSAAGTPDAEALAAEMQPTTDPEATFGTASCGHAETEPATRHTVEATIDYAAKTVEARQITRHINRESEALNDLVFNVEPNYWLNAFEMVSVTGAAETTLTGRRLVIALAEPLETGCALQVELAFKLNIPQIGAGIAGFKGYFGYTSEQINLGHWLPTLALRVNNAWITRESFFAGEQNVLDIADWDVTWTLANADNVTVAAPGTIEDLGEGKGRGTMQRARDYSLSLSDTFIVLRDLTVTGIPVELYTLGSTEVTAPNGQLVDGAPHALTMAIRALELFSEKFGAYIYPRMIVVEGDFPDGMEFSGFAFVSRTWFRQYVGQPDGFLTLITVHEVAHQWWYARVGSDSAMTPWLDEALSTYCEHLFLEQFYPNLTAWWWDFRVNAYAPSGFVDSSVYEFTTLREYINAIYLNGVRMLHQLRIDLGEGVYFDLMKRYVTAYDGKVVGSTAFWGLLTEDQLAATRTTRAQFLRRADF